MAKLYSGVLISYLGVLKSNIFSFKVYLDNSSSALMIFSNDDLSLLLKLS